MASFQQYLRSVFLRQFTQNKDAEATHIKLDEIIGALDNTQTLYTWKIRMGKSSIEFEVII